MTCKYYTALVINNGLEAREADHLMVEARSRVGGHGRAAALERVRRDVGALCR